MGIPIIVQPSQAEKNRAGQVAKTGAMPPIATANPGPMKLYVGSLHFNITEDMLRGIFEPFGRVDEIILMKDHDTGRSKGFGFITVQKFTLICSFFSKPALRLMYITYNAPVEHRFRIIFSVSAFSSMKEKMQSGQWNN